MLRPLIGISGNCFDTRPAPLRSGVNDAYIRAVTDAGGTPFILPYTDDTEAVENMISHLDGLLLSGGQDIYPPRYGEDVLPKCGPLNPGNDCFDFLLLESAEKRKLPILAICRGLQVVNVFHDGTLYQDISYMPEESVAHNLKGNRDLPAHTIMIEAHSRLQDILKKTEWSVNSLHHQAVKEVGKGLVVTARAKDGVVEALELQDYPYLQAYQFHPEEMYASNYFAKQLFYDFIKESAKYMISPLK